MSAEQWEDQGEDGPGDDKPGTVHQAAADQDAKLPADEHASHQGL